MNEASKLLHSFVSEDQLRGTDGYITEFDVDALSSESIFSREMDAIDLLTDTFNKACYIEEKLSESVDLSDDAVNSYEAMLNMVMTPVNGFNPEALGLSMEARDGGDGRTKVEKIIEKVQDFIQNLYRKLKSLFQAAYRKAKQFIKKRFSAGARLAKRLDKQISKVQDLAWNPEKQTIKAKLPMFRSHIDGGTFPLKAIEAAITKFSNLDVSKYIKDISKTIQEVPIESFGTFLGKEMKRSKFEFKYDAQSWLKTFVERIESSILTLFSDLRLQPISNEIQKSINIDIKFEEYKNVYSSLELPGGKVMVYALPKDEFIKTKQPLVGLKGVKNKGVNEDQEFAVESKTNLISLLSASVKGIKDSYTVSDDLSDGIQDIINVAEKNFREDMSSTLEDDKRSGEDTTEYVRKRRAYSLYHREMFMQISRGLRMVLSNILGFTNDFSAYALSLAAEVESYTNLCITAYGQGEPDDPIEPNIKPQDNLLEDNS